MNEIIKKVKNNIEQSLVGLHEREEVMKLTYLSLMAGESIFMLGLPGVAKSLIGRRIKYSMNDDCYFEYLMNKFSTPEEIFGPISLKALDEDKYERKIEGYLPTATIAFLDEIWKSSPAIQNTLLTIINEKVYKNGNKVSPVPLKLLISASNELPQDSSLDALYDRFLIRYCVKGSETEKTFIKIITSSGEGKFDETKYTPLSNEEIKEIKTNANSIRVNKTVIKFILSFKKDMFEKLKEKAPYVSDRRWKKIVNLLKTNALMSNRNQVSMVDVPLILHCIAYDPRDMKEIKKIFDKNFANFIIEDLITDYIKINKLIKDTKDNIHWINFFEQNQECKKEGMTYRAYKVEDEEDKKVWIPINDDGSINTGFDNSFNFFNAYETSDAAVNIENAEQRWTNRTMWDLKRNTYNEDKTITKVTVPYRSDWYLKLEKNSIKIKQMLSSITSISDNLKSNLQIVGNKNSLFVHSHEKYIMSMTKRFETRSTKLIAELTDLINQFDEIKSVVEINGKA